MKVTIVGFGHVGRSLWEIEKEHHTVSVCDKKADAIKAVPNSTTDLKEALSDTDLVQVCFPVPVKHSKPDMESFLEDIRAIGNVVSDDALVIIESTVPVTTTQKVAEVLGGNYVAYSPVRGAAPHMIEDIKKIPKIVGGINEESTERAIKFYKSVEINPIPVEHPRIAELFKLINNVWQDINIAYANEWARIATFYEVDPEDIIQLMKTSLKREVRTYGYVGGHCVPTNPFLLCADVQSPLVTTARRTNEEVIQKTIQKVRKIIGNKGSTSVAVVGLSYKSDTPSTANSPGIRIVNGLKEEADIFVYDPLLDEATLNKHGSPVEADQLESMDIIVNCHSLPTPPPKDPKIINAKNIWEKTEAKKRIQNLE